jgi:hypothetical protein
VVSSSFFFLKQYGNLKKHVGFSVSLTIKTKLVINATVNITPGGYEQAAMPISPFLLVLSFSLI